MRWCTSDVCLSVAYIGPYIGPSGLPSRTILDQTYSAQRFYIFSLIFSFYFVSCGRLSWLNSQLSSARYYSIFTYLLYFTPTNNSSYIGRVISFYFVFVFCICTKSRTERPRKTKIGTEVAHVTRDSDTTFKVKGQRWTCRGGGILWRPPAELVTMTMMTVVVIRQLYT